MKRTKILIFGGITIFMLIAQFMGSVNLNPMYPDSAFFYLFFASLYLGAWIVLKVFKISLADVVQTRNGNIKFEKRSGVKAKYAVITLVCLWAVFIVFQILSSSFFQWKNYRDQLGELEVRNFEGDVQPMDINQLPIVDIDLAKKLADKKLGEKTSLGSQVILGEPVIQRVKGNLVWVVPLYHSGFFKWLANIEGTPGYITVSATNSEDVKYVEGHKIKYQINSYFLYDVERYSRYNGGLFTGIADYSFEIDDNGKPFWVITTYKNLKFFALSEATGVITLDATNGKTETYTMKNIPSWIDRVQPEQFIMDQVTNKGQYVHGIFNFSNKDKFQTSQGNIIVYNKNRCYLFTGLTSVGTDESAIGFIMVDMVTKQPINYKISGATEFAAQGSAMEKVQHLKYNASFPLILNVSSNPTYFMTLKGNEGLIKQYAFVSVKNYSIVGVGETIPDALRDFEKAMKSSGLSGNLNTGIEKKVINSTVLRISSEQEGTSVVYKILTNEEKDILFIVDSSMSEELAITREGDKIKIEYSQNKNGLVAANSFDNLEFTQKAG